MPKKKIDLTATTPVMLVDVYKVLYECVERGVQFGWHHAHKHTDTPAEFQIRDQICGDVMTEICEYFKFPD